MHKVVINNCYGGFGLSRAAVRRIAELTDRPCYFFDGEFTDDSRHFYRPLGDDAEPRTCWWAFDIPNPNEVLGQDKAWHEQTPEEKKARNDLYDKHNIPNDRQKTDRADPLLVRVVEELGAKANGSHAELKVVEVPDGVEWQIEEYDGNEWVAEKHRRWA